MLILTRKIEEEIIFTVPPSGSPRHVRVKLVAIDNRKVRLGIEADTDVRILRGELPDAQRIRV